MTEIPFYPCERRRCAQAAMKSALKAIMPERDFSYEELDRLTYHDEKEITFPSQIASGFMQLGVDFRYYVKPKWKELVLSSDTHFFQLVMEQYGENANMLLSKTNTTSLRKSIEVLVGTTHVIEINKKPRICELEIMLKNEEIPICLVNYDFIAGRENRFGGHYLIITGFNDEEVIYHDSGPKNAGPNKICSKERLERSLDLCFFDWGLINVPINQH